MLAALIQAASEGAPSLDLDAWTADAEHQEPAEVHAAVGSAWKLHNDLRVLSQYCRVLADACRSSPFLLGAPSTCVEGLEWFKGFAQPVAPLSVEELDGLREFLGACMLHRGTATQGEAAFDAHRAIAHPERQLTQFLVEQHFPGPLKQYELDVCAYMLADPKMTYQAWKESFRDWRLEGLLYPLGIAATYMPTLDCWLPQEAHESMVALSFDTCLRSMRDPTQNRLWALMKLEEDWEKDTTGAADVLSGKLDRLAVLMGVKSNGGAYELSEALRYFAETFPTAELGAPASALHQQNYAAWHGLKQAVEETFPPSLLSAPLVRPKRETWGYPRLTLVLDTDGPLTALRFAQTRLQRVGPEDLRASFAHTYQPAHARECTLQQTSLRIQEVLWRLGETVTSPDLALCMLRPDVALASLFLSPAQQAAARLGQALTVQGVLDKMEAGSDEVEPLRECYEAYTRALDSSVPEPVAHFLPRPQAALFWRLDTPPRAILCLGGDAEPLAQSTHHLPKVMVNCKVPHRATGGILRAPADAGVDHVRAALGAFAREGLSTHPANTVLLNQSEAESRNRQVAPATCTTLAESVACFALTAPDSLTNCQLGGSCAWKEDGIDPRYAEKQHAANGFRYRDWTAVHVSKSGTQQSRLAAHLVCYDCIHTTALPWFTDQGETRWVQMSSTLCPEPRTLQGRSLRHAVESRFLHDVRMLPTEGGRRVSKSNCEIYTDRSGAVGIAYCLDGSDELQFACFECKLAM